MGDRVAVMRKGELQQVATPQELYDHPVNMFVGGFIGSPAMNMLEARIEQRDGALVVMVGESALALDDATAARARACLLRRPDVVLGIRPEDLEDAALSEERRDHVWRSGDAARGARCRGARPLHDRRAPGSDRRDA